MKYDLPQLNGPKDFDATVAYLDAWGARWSGIAVEDHLETILDKAHLLNELAAGLKLEDGEPDQVSQQTGDGLLQEIEAQADAVVKLLEPAS